MSAALANPAFIPSKEREDVCDGCGEPFRRGTQLWRCHCCNAVRVWGNVRPEGEAKYFKAALNCANCREVTRHSFVGMGGQDF